ncbi:hypothetical protein KQX54_020745 [Cotesia glomerata]|uniref:Uncharacterized protein n=1 Tax=Cotesia glomerata TaxID=32391 RepID=A0AAV7I1T1_COTGL|nr:hypothetical protein KQX54_020745 [Cotesia glomerata]
MAGALSENAPRPVSVVTVDGGTPQTVEPPPETTIQENSNGNGVRCFASTEAQTDMGLTPRVEGINPGCDDLRDARRRERRVRRHHRRAMRSCSMPPTYPGGPGCVQANAGVGTAPGMPLVPPVGGFLHPPPPHLGLRGLSLGLPFPVPASVSAFGREIRQKCIHTLSSILNTVYSTLLHTKTKAAHKFHYYHTFMYEYQRFMRKIPEPEAMNRRIASIVLVQSRQ